MQEILHYATANPWMLYGIVLLAPFVQEDAAVLSAAALSAGNHGDTWLLFAAVLLGLTGSDIWKYWAGAMIPCIALAKRWFAHPRVEAARNAVTQRLGISLLAARFIPGTRIPMYVGAGRFGASFKRFIVILVAAGVFYVGVAFWLVGALGQSGSRYLTTVLPIILAALLFSLLVVRATRSMRAPSANKSNAIGGPT